MQYATWCPQSSDLMSNTWNVSTVVIHTLIGSSLASILIKGIFAQAAEECSERRIGGSGTPLGVSQIDSPTDDVPFKRPGKALLLGNRTSQAVSKYGPPIRRSSGRPLERKRRVSTFTHSTRAEGSSLMKRIAT